MASIDRLSSLPDDVICRILSFLPTNFSVQTSVLAKRYMFLWTYVPILSFDGEYHTETRFAYMINKVMLLSRAQCINTFRLCYEYDHLIEFKALDLVAWITTAIERNVQTIDLGLLFDEDGEQFMLPRRLFSCETLVVLKLSDCTFPSFNGCSMSLPRLKSLYLRNVNHVVDDALPCLLSCCPVLDELFISELVCGNNYDISSPSIKRLSVNFYNNCVDVDHFDYELKINAPALEYLKLVNDFWLVISAHMLTSLTEADLSFDMWYEVDSEDYFLDLISFLESLCSVRCLKLCAGSLFSSWGKPLTRFDNLTKLEFGGDWNFLMNLIESAENLEVLIIRQKGDDEVMGEWTEPKQVPMCLFSRLKTVKFDQFWCEEEDFEAVGYFLRNARVLERMEIYSADDMFDSKDKLVALQRISMFERASVACKVYFSA